VPAVRQKLHLSPCSDFRDQLCPLAYADCADINREATERYAALIATKEIYKADTLRAQSTPFSIETLTEGIALNAKMKAAMDNMIDNLSRAKAAGCLGNDTEKWTAAITKFRADSEEIGKTRAMLVRLRSEMEKQARGEASKKLLDEQGAQVKSDSKGELGRKAREACNRIHGITVPVQTGKDVLRSYGLQKAKDWTDCVVNYMYPIPAPPR
jgi:hypothetical protein